MVVVAVKVTSTILQMVLDNLEDLVAAAVGVLEQAGLVLLVKVTPVAKAMDLKVVLQLAVAAAAQERLVYPIQIQVTAALVYNG